MTSVYAFDSLLTPDGWLSPGWLAVDAAGDIAAVSGDAPDGAAAERIAGHAIPGMPNLHSHAFQRAMAGLAEHGAGTEDSFWSWRDVMYRFVGRMSPDDLEAVARQLYVEMLKAGYTSVGEFHYLHHAPDGSPYADAAEMSLRIAAAARNAGIGLTLLPVLYQTGGFGGAPAGPAQCRFVNGTESFLALVDGLHGRFAGAPEIRVGIAPHSLRAVPPEALAAALDGLDAIDPAAPIHIHIAEQPREVAECVDWCGQRPVEWLLANAPVGPRWCLVHATHMTATETAALAASGAVAGLCPTTEANLGDGLFPLAAWLDGGGALGVGSDSHVSVSPVEELRWLEYGQRLAGHRRNVAAGGARSTGTALYRAALAGGARALGRPVGALAAGCRADIVVLDGDHPGLAGREGDNLLDSLIFSGNTTPVRDVMAGGAWVVRDGRHRDEDAVTATYRETAARLCRAG